MKPISYKGELHIIQQLSNLTNTTIRQDPPQNSLAVLDRSILNTWLPNSTSPCELPFQVVLEPYSIPREDVVGTIINDFNNRTPDPLLTCSALSIGLLKILL